MNPWLILLTAGLFEMGWPLGFKLAQTVPSWRVAAIVFSLLSMAMSGLLLYLAQRHSHRDGLCRLDGHRRRRHLLSRRPPVR